MKTWAVAQDVFRRAHSKTDQKSFSNGFVVLIAKVPTLNGRDAIRSIISRGHVVEFMNRMSVSVRSTSKKSALMNYIGTNAASGIRPGIEQSYIFFSYTLRSYRLGISSIPMTV
jgi:hypothetical protein